MNFIKNKLFLFVSGIFVVLTCFEVSSTEWDIVEHDLSSDVSSYYTYLPAIFIYQDIGLEFVSEIEDGKWEHRIWRDKSPIGKYNLKMTMGLSILYLPFFLLGHLISILLNLDANGYTLVYSKAIILGGILYLSIGLYYLAKLLQKWFSNSAVYLSIVLILFGTNLFVYSSFLGMYSHSFSFFLFSIFLYCVDRFYLKHKKKHFIILCITYGLITLIRPTNGIIVLFLLAYDVKSFSQVKERIVFYLYNKQLILILILSVFIIWLPQLFYWKYTCGTFFYNSYLDESFYFSKPRILSGLLGFRKGLFIYTPLMFFSFLGIVFMFKNKVVREKLFIATMMFIPLNIYIILSWWCWWFGGSFGHRAFIESFVIMAIPLAALIDFSLKKNKLTYFWLVTLSFFILYLNQFQSWQYKKEILHYDNMTADAYISIFGEEDFPQNYHCLIKEPLYELAKYEGKDSVKSNCENEVWIKGANKRRVVPKGAPFNHHYATQLYYDKVNYVLYTHTIYPRKIDLSFDENDIYELIFYNDDEEIARHSFQNKEIGVHGMQEYHWNTPIELLENGFDKIIIKPLSGDQWLAVGHIIPIEE